MNSSTQTLLTGSYQVKDGLQLWDLRNLQLLKSIPWCDKPSSTDDISQILCAKFTNPSKDYIIAGGTNKNVAKILSVATGKVHSVFGGLNKACLVAETSMEGGLALIGCADGSLNVKNLLYD